MDELPELYKYRIGDLLWQLASHTRYDRQILYYSAIAHEDKKIFKLNPAKK